MGIRRLINSLLLSIVVLIFTTGFSLDGNTHNGEFEAAACRSIGAT